jgi:hypothetical protein
VSVADDFFDDEEVAPRAHKPSNNGSTTPPPASEEDYGIVQAPPAPVDDEDVGGPEKSNGKGKGDGADKAPPTIPLLVSDFIAFSPDHTYIHRATGETWTSTAVNARVMPVETGGGQKMLTANTWLDRNDAVEQRVWAPGLPQIIENRLVAEGGFFAKPGARVFNVYKPPQIIVSASSDVRFWRDRLYALWPEQAVHIECWLAHRAQRPGEKINHALVLGGKPGIGKDAVLDPLKRAVGPWNFAEISPQAVLGTFNEFARSVVLRISEGKDLGDTDRFVFYEATKTLIAAPPDTLRINPKYVSPYYVLNVTGIIITTNHKVGGLFLPPDDRRHFVAWSTVEPSDFSSDAWTKYWTKLNAGGAEAVVDHLKALDLAHFNPKAPPPHTQAFWEMVNAMRTEEESEMADIIEDLGNPKALIITDIIARANALGAFAFVTFLQERKNARLIFLRLEQCGYRRLANPDEHAGRWRVGSQRTGVYVRQNITDREGFEAVKDLDGLSEDNV